jgi:hypothetical protein
MKLLQNRIPVIRKKNRTRLQIHPVLEVISMNKEAAELAFQGNWTALLPLLREHPSLVNSAKEPKGYTPLHQAAWHGETPSVIGQLLALGANPTIRTINNNQTAREIATEKHESRSDLQFLLSEQGRTLAQLMRKIVSESPDLFTAYDGNKILCDRLIESFGSDSVGPTQCDYEERLTAAFKAVTGVEMSSCSPIQCGYLDMQADPSFWANRFLNLLSESGSRQHTTPVEKHWAVVSDLFDPAPAQWGMRGDPFLWMEMRQALCHVPIPESTEVLARIISCAFTALTGTELNSRADVDVPRLAKGPHGCVSGEFWNDVFIPMMQQRKKWFQESWGEK